MIDIKKLCFCNYEKISAAEPRSDNTVYQSDNLVYRLNVLVQDALSSSFPFVRHKNFSQMPINPVIYCMFGSPQNLLGLGECNNMARSG
jgi:hypothetical protein